MLFVIGYATGRVLPDRGSGVEREPSSSTTVALAETVHPPELTATDHGHATDAVVESLSEPESPAVEFNAEEHSAHDSQLEVSEPNAIDEIAESAWPDSSDDSPPASVAFDLGDGTDPSESDIRAAATSRGPDVAEPDPWAHLNPEPKPTGRSRKESAIMRAADLVSLEDHPPSAWLKARSSEIAIGRVLYLNEPATITSVLPDRVQLQLSDGTSAFLSGIDVSTLVTGRQPSPGLVFVEGTEQYTAVSGARLSAWVLTSVSTSEWQAGVKKQHVRRAIEKRERSRERIQSLQSTLQPKVAKLKSADGEHETEAFILGLRDGAALLRKLDGTEISVPIAKLDRKSKSLVRDWQETVAKATKEMASLQRELDESATVK